MSDGQIILVAGLLLGAGLIAAKAADRVRIPGLLLFLALGILIGSEGPGGVEFADTELTRTLGTIALILILFEGGLAAGWGEIRPVFGIAVSLAFIGTLVTALIAGAAAYVFFDLTLLGGLIVGSAVAATDSAAIFAVLRGSTLRRKLARALEGESGMNDPIALLLVVGFIEWIEVPAYGFPGMAFDFATELLIGLIGIPVGLAARWAFRNLDLPTPGLYPVASIATMALAYGLADVAHGSGFLAVYLAALILGTGSVPAKGTVIAFHQGLSWVSQISLFALLGLLVFPSGLADVALPALGLSIVLIFLARPVAALAATALTDFDIRERLMLGWAGLRGAIPIWLATFPVVAGIADAEEIFNIIFFVVLTSTLVQGATFEPLAERLGLTTQEPALPEAIVETGIIRRLGGESLIHRVRDDDAAVGKLVRDLELPREALVHVIVRGETAIPPRGSTAIEAGDELHVIARQSVLGEVEGLLERWRSGPLGREAVPTPPVRSAPQIFTVRPWSEASDGDSGSPDAIDGAAVIHVLRTRRDIAGSLVQLADGRVAVTGEGLVASGDRRRVSEWCVRRMARADLEPERRAWWQEVAGALSAAGSAGPRARS